MKKSLLLLTITFGAAGLLGIASSVQPAHAAGIYHAIKVKTYSQTPVHWTGENRNASIWNYHLNHKLHRLNMMDNSTLYATKTLKMTNGKKTGIFYYVTDNNGVKGYVWRGYMAKGVLPAGEFPNPGGIPNADDDELEDLQGQKVGNSVYNEQVAAKQNTDAYSLFGFIKAGAGLPEAAKLYAQNPNDPMLKQAPYSHMKFITNSSAPTKQQRQALVTGKLSFKDFVSADLKKQGIDPNKYSTRSNDKWFVGITSSPIYLKANKTTLYPKFGQYTIALLAPQYKSEVEK